MSEPKSTAEVRLRDDEINLPIRNPSVIDFSDTIIEIIQ
jgi:hypothetical protein